VTAGETPAEALELLRDAMAAWLESAIEHGDPIPAPSEASKETYSGRLLLRMPKTLHRDLAKRAEREGVSLNQHVVALLSAGNAAAGPRTAAQPPTEGIGVPLAAMLESALEAQNERLRRVVEEPLARLQEEFLNQQREQLRELVDAPVARLRQELEDREREFVDRQRQRVQELVDEPLNRLREEIAEGRLPNRPR
jgi:predicted HicB family RNase H-like nuclease